MKVSKFFKYYIGISIVGFLILLLFFPKQKSGRDFYDKILNKTLKEDYEGVIVKKFIDIEDHERVKVIINKDNIEKIIYLDYEDIFLFNFIRLGDTIIKRKNTLEIELKREGLDTIIQLKFENIKM